MGRERESQERDVRVKRKIFPFFTFLSAFVAFGVFTTVQMKIIGEAIDYRNVSVQNWFAVIGSWVLVAAAFTLWTNFQITIYYQKPIEIFSEAAHKVASGDFSVYLAPNHTKDKFTHLDVLFMDFNKMVEELGSIETLKTDFFSNVSHEIRTPLAVIQNNVQLLRTEGLEEERRGEYAEAILHATRRLSNLITNMLKLNKLEKQTIKPVPQLYDLCAQLCECALQFEDVWERKGIDFEVDTEDRMMIEADEGLLELVWTNLLSNAMKFTPSGGNVKLSQALDGEWITVSVADNGCGMDELTRKRMFDKFYQGDTSHATEGNGLGLALVKRILQLSDGSIEVTSAVGEGTVFTVRLPKSQTLNREET